jgi:hypothetical protein
MNLEKIYKPYDDSLYCLPFIQPVIKSNVYSNIGNIRIQLTKRAITGYGISPVIAILNRQSYCSVLINISSNFT